MSKLTGIIELIHGDCPYNQPCPVERQGYRALIEWVNEVIGEDEPETMDVDGKTVHLIHFNQLRAEQRKRAGL